MASQTTLTATNLETLGAARLADLLIKISTPLARKVRSSCPSRSAPGYWFIRIRPNAGADLDA